MVTTCKQTTALDDSMLVFLERLGVRCFKTSATSGTNLLNSAETCFQRQSLCRMALHLGASTASCFCLGDSHLH